MIFISEKPDSPIKLDGQTQYQRAHGILILKIENSLFESPYVVIVNRF
jgi:hypothetical protein